MPDMPVPASLKVLPAGHDRRMFLGGSDVAAIMGLGATYRGVQQTPYTVWCKKVGEVGEEMDPETRLFLERRKRWEGPIIEMLREEFSAEIVSVNKRYIDPEFDFMAAEIDFEWKDPDGRIQNGEIKTVYPMAFGEKFGWGEEGTADVPVHYAAQVMHGMGVTGATQCVVAAMVGLDSMVFYKIDRDEDTIQAMRDECRRFWFENVLPKVPPAPQTVIDLKGLMLRFQGRPCELDEDTYAKFQKLLSVRAGLTALEDQEETLAFEVGAYVLADWREADQAVAEDATLLFDGKPVASWKKQGHSHLDQKRLKVEKPEVVSEYTKRSVIRVLRPIKPKS
jgi:predicted phage-related endonuclease